jgi:3-deoxy-7-phosphoheptulonate synthase
MPSVRRLVEVSAPYRLASRELFGEDLAIRVPAGESLEVAIGGRAALGVIVSSRWASASGARFGLLAPLLREAGCRIFHAGQLTISTGRNGSGELTPDAVAELRDIAHANELALCVEVADAGHIDVAAELADLLQVGSRNMQDFSLLREMGRATTPVLLRRGAGATVEEFLLAAEYVLLHGNGKVILCESGIRTFDALHKPRFEINAVPLVKQLSHLPLVADPSQTAPHAAAVPAMAKAAIAAGADGLVLEVGTEAVYDPAGVAIDIEAMRRLTAELRPIARAVGRTIGSYQATDSLLPPDPAGVLRMTDRTLAQTIESLTGAPPSLDVVAQWRLAPPVSWLSPPLSATGEILARCTGYRMGSVRLSRNLSYVDLGQIDPTLGALLEATQLNLGQLFVDPRIEKLHFEFGTHEDAGEIDETFRRCFPDDVGDLHPYVWRRYQAAIGGVVTFVVIEALPVPVWERILDQEAAGVFARSGPR